jgi:hypothetical protein
MIKYVNYLSLAALTHTHKDGPQVAGDWLEEAFTAHLGGYTPASPSDRPAATRSWAVGGVLGTETLVQSRPVVRDPATRFTDDFLRAPSQCILAGFVAAQGKARPPRFGVTRFQRWIALAGNTGMEHLGEDDHRALRDRLRGALPPFIQRSLVDGSDRELIGMAAIARLHAATSLGKTYAAPELFREALNAVDASLEEAQVDLLVSDGRTLGVLHRGGRALALRPPAVAGRRPLADGRTLEDAREAALLVLISPPDAAPAETDGEAEAIADGVFTVGARHPVRIRRD